MSLLALRSIMFAVVAVSIAAFIVVENKVKEPILELKFFKNKNFVLLALIATLVGASMLGSILYLTQFNQQVFGASPTESGLMLLPMIAGLMVVSIVSGQIVAKTGSYKKIMIAGFAVGTVAIASLLTLNPSSTFLQEGIIMVFVGMGLGAVMPLLNVAVQNEFEQKYLGIVTGANQLFRGLGSTIGVAVFGSMLTVGITNVLGDMGNDPYIQTLKQSPAASQMISNVNDADTLLNLNTSVIRDKVTDGLDKGLETSPAPAVVKDKIKQDLKEKQDAYSKKVIDAFTVSLHYIFVITSGIMLVAGALSFFLKERPLRTATVSETPGE
jgi:hypothetical protein